MSSIIEALILLVVIMDPIASMCVLLSISKHRSRHQIHQIALKAVFVAFIVFAIFAVGGDAVLKVLGVSLDSFKVAGGIILAILGIQMVLGFNIPKEKNREDVSESAVVIGTPLIAGPAVITTTMILVKDIGYVSTLGAGIGALLVVLAVLFVAEPIRRITGKSGLAVLSTMMGLVTVAWGAQFIISGVLGSLV